MVDFAGIDGGLALLREQIDGADMPDLGDDRDFGTWAKAMADMQAAVVAEEQASTDARIDYAGLPAAITLIEQSLSPDALSIHGTPVTEATVDVEYVGFTVTASGGEEPYIYTDLDGTLPTGITINSATGEVAGTPTVEDTFIGIILRVTDNLGNHADLAPFTIDVTAATSVTLVAAAGANITIVDDLTMVRNTDSGFSNGVALASATQTGKRYWETVNTCASFNWVGAANTPAYTGADTAEAGYAQNNGNEWNNLFENIDGGPGWGSDPGVVVGHCADEALGKRWDYYDDAWHGAIGSNDPATGVGGRAFASSASSFNPFGRLYGQDDSITFRFAEEDWTLGVCPSGFSACVP